MVIPNQNLIFYTCVGKESIIVAEFFFNSVSDSDSDSDLRSFAAKCIEMTPPFHSVFSHTTGKKTFTFLIQSPFVFFGIFHFSLHKSENLNLLNSIKNHIFSLKTPLEDTSCFQAQLNLLFHQLFPLPASNTTHTNPGRLISSSPSPSPSSSYSLCEDNSSIRLKRKMPLLTENNLDMDMDCDDGGGGGDDLNKEFSVQNRKSRSLLGSDSGEQHKGKAIWNKQVWVLLSLDLIVCSILFFTWLWICRGLKCVHR